jgi:hypothetical protein
MLKNSISSLLVLFLITHVIANNVLSYFPKEGLVRFWAVNRNMNNLITNYLTNKDVVFFSDEKLDNMASYPRKFS